MTPLTRISILSVITILGCGRAVWAQVPSHSCSDASLRGEYAFNASGFNILNGVALPKAVVEFVRFNGDGTLTVLAATRSVNGVVTRSPLSGVGTYTVAADCTGSVVFGPPGPTFDLFLGPDSLRGRMIQTTDPTPGALPVMQGILEKIAR